MFYVIMTENWENRKVLLDGENETSFHSDRGCFQHLSMLHCLTEITEFLILGTKALPWTLGRIEGSQGY